MLSKAIIMLENFTSIKKKQRCLNFPKPKYFAYSRLQFALGFKNLQGSGLYSFILTTLKK